MSEFNFFAVSDVGISRETCYRLPKSSFFQDPYAAEILLQISATHPALRGKPLPLHILPLDITHQHTVPYGSLVKEGSDLDGAPPLSKL